MSDETEVKSKKKGVEAYSPDHLKYSMIGQMMEGKATLRRLTKDQMAAEALLLGAAEKGIKLEGTLKFVEEMRDLSSGYEGKGIEAVVNVLKAAPVTLMPGSPYEAQGPSIFQRLVNFVRGSGSSGDKQ